MIESQCEHLCFYLCPVSSVVYLHLHAQFSRPLPSSADRNRASRASFSDGPSSKPSFGKGRLNCTSISLYKFNNQ